ncbi:hypothetical protein DMN91_002931 [Ooceraea biroi]|uniref:Mos1 transposase HTH domain-containing protein n=1 Tax=Ooceraea biroi TaxID=2015173 RepID=A0A3L8DWL6_OOCBI|nr:hypothetical protein DMN91_002931 [Ooceraea biroi]
MEFFPKSTVCLTFMQVPEHSLEFERDLFLGLLQIYGLDKPQHPSPSTFRRIPSTLALCASTANRGSNLENDLRFGEINRIAKASSGAAFVSKKKAAEARLAAQEGGGGLQLEEYYKEEDIFELQHHHLLRCLEKTTNNGIVLAMNVSCGIGDNVAALRGRVSDRFVANIIHEAGESLIGTPGSETARNINAVFGEGSTTKATVGNWFINFRDGDFSLVNEPRGRPKTKMDNDHLRAVVESDPSQSTRELASIFNVSIPTILVHLAAIGAYRKLYRENNGTRGDERRPLLDRYLTSMEAPRFIPTLGYLPKETQRNAIKTSPNLARKKAEEIRTDLA